MTRATLCLNPRFVGQVFRHVGQVETSQKMSPNPRFVGQVYRLTGGYHGITS